MVLRSARQNYDGPIDRDALRALVTALPWAWREDVVGYANAVADAADQIYAEAGLTVDDVPRDDFLGASMAWRLWSKLDAQYRMVRDSLTVAEQQGIAGFVVGQASYASGSRIERELADLRAGVRHAFVAAGADYLLLAVGPKDILIRMASADGA